VSDSKTKPAQFRFPAWAHEFLAEESASTGASKTEILVEALETYKTKRLEERMAEGYREMSEEDLLEAKQWEPTLADGLGEEW
jgi:hypothetical protein